MILSEDVDIVPPIQLFVILVPGTVRAVRPKLRLQDILTEHL